VCAYWGFWEDKPYLLHLARKRLDYLDLTGAVKQQALPYAAKNIAIEGRASGTQLLQDLREDGVHDATDTRLK
jgi:phage terminase large subunit-like protein